MKKKILKKSVSLLLAVMMIFSLLPQLTVPAQAADAQTTDADDMTSNELAKAWGFTTAQPADSQERDALGTNPWKGHTDTVSTFGMVPRGIAVVGSRISTADDDYHSQNNADRGNINTYDSIAINTQSENKKFLSMNHTGTFTDVDGLTDKSEADTRPCATLAADVNGDGTDEIIRYYIDISKGANDGDIDSFNAGDSGYVADFYVEVIDSQTGKRLNTKDSGQVLEVDKSDSGSEDFFIPDSVYFWSSYLQITAGDYDNDGKADIAVMVPGKNANTGNGKLVVLSLDNGSLVQKYSQSSTFYSSYDKDNSANTKFSSYDLTSGDCDNDGTDELVYTTMHDAVTEDEESYIAVIDYTAAAGYTKPVNHEVRVGGNHDIMGNAGVTVGDIDNDGLEEIIVGGFMVNADSPNNTYTYTAKDNSTTKSIKYYHEMAMSYMEYDNAAAEYTGFTGFSVFRDDEKTAETSADGNETSYMTYSDRTLNSTRRYRNAGNWTIPMQAVSLTGYVNDKTNDQIFFGNYMYYFDSATGLFKVYDSDGEVDVDSDHVLYHNFQQFNSSIISLAVGNFLTVGSNELPAEGKQELLAEYVRDKDGKTISFELANLYQNTGDTMATQRCIKYIGTADSDNFYQKSFYPTICTPNLADQTTYVQYVGHDFTYTEPEVLDVIASVPYFQDILDAYPAGVWGDPGETSLENTSGSSSTDTASTEVSLGWYFNFHQDVSVLGIRLFSVEAETNASVNTNYEYSKTVEKESSIEYSTSEGQDSVVMVSSPLDVYQYRYYKGTAEYKKLFPGAKKDDPGTWGLMEASLPGTPATMVFPVDRYNALAQKYGLDHIGSNFWTHTLGEPGTYPTSTDDFLNASNVIDSPNTVSATMGAGSETSSLSITETEESAYGISFTLGAKFGAGAGGIVMGTTVENTTGYGGSKASYEGTKISATLNNFPEQEKYGADLDTEGYSLSTTLHSYTTTFNDNNIMVLEFTVEGYNGLPRRVENFRCTGSTEGSLDLAWEVPSVISAELKPNKYILERYDPYYKKWETIDGALTAAAGTNTYTDTDVYAGEDYQYRLISSDSMGTVTNAVELTASTRDPGQDPPEITQQPVDVTAGVGASAQFSTTAATPEGSAPTRIYYQWYMRENSKADWSEVDGATGKTLTLTTVTEDMNGYQYCCEATRLVTDGSHCTSQSNYATLSVLNHTPVNYKVSFSSDNNGTLTAQQVYTNSSTAVNSGTSLPEGSTVKFTAVPASGYAVSKWVINGKTVSGNTENSLVVEDLSATTTVSVSFRLALYSFRYSETIDSGDTSHGTITAECNGNTLPQAEDTTLPGNSKITIHATPDPGYMVYYLSDNKTHGGYYINDLTIDSLSYDTKVSVKFTKAVYYNVTVHSSIVNADVAYADDSGYSVYANGTELAPGADIPANAKVEIAAKLPKSAIVDSWTIYMADSNGKTMGTPITLGSQNSYTFDQLSSSYSVTINYRVVTSKTLTYSIKGGSGTLSAQVVGNTAASGKVSSGGKVQMYQDVALTVSPGAGEQLSGWLVNGVLESSNATTKIVNMNKNTVVQAVIETKPTVKSPGYALTMNANHTISLAGNSVADDADGDTLTFTSIEDDGTTDPNVATVKLGSGTNSGKLLVTSVREGITSVKAEVSDDSGNSILVTIPITVSNNSQTVPTLTGVMNSAAGVNDGKITGLDSTVTYCYKSADETDYHTVTGKTAITGLTPGEYTVYCPARTGYTESDKVTVTVESNDFAGGTGTAGDPYRITTPSMLDKVRNHMDKCFILINDIDMAEYLSETGDGYNDGQGFIPLGSGSEYFFGTFDGNGKKITGLTIDQSAADVDCVGLFASVQKTGIVKNLGVDVDISAKGDCVGGIAGKTQGMISRCYVTGQITGIKNSYVGGLAGVNIGTIENCYSTAAISGYNAFAGLVGYLQVSGSGYYQRIGTITTSYSISKFTFPEGTTGLTAGCLIAEMDTDAIIKNSWAYMTYTNSYNPINSDTYNNKNELYTLDTLKSKDWYENSTYDKWDFDNIWSIDDGNDFPKLRNPIYVTDIILDEIEASFSVGDEHTLTAVVEPDDAASQGLYWISSDTEVVDVDQTGLITAVSAGTAEITVGSCDGSGVTATCTVTVSAPQANGISLSQTTDYTFTNQTTGYDALNPLSVTVSNTGNQATGDLSVALTGTGKDSFTLSKNAVSSIEAGDTDGFTVVPNTGLSAGTYTATVTVSGDNVTSQTFDISFTVSDQQTYGISLSRTTDYTFIGQTAGYSSVSPLGVTVSNTGTQDTGVLTLTLSGDDTAAFELSADEIPGIASGETYDFDVNPITGLSVGTYTATVTVSGDNVTSQTFDISFTVSDQQTYGISLSRTTDYAFTGQTAGYSSVSPLGVTVSNTGNQATGDLTVALTGTGKDSFALSKSAVSSIEAGETDSFTVVPNTGLSAGTYTATVTVSGDNVTTQTFDISFTVSDQQTYGISLSRTTDYTFTGQTAGYSSVSPLGVTVSNTGTQDTGVLTLTLSGDDTAAFELSADEIPGIASGETYDFDVNPITGLSVGTYTATVTVSGDNVTTQTFDISFAVSNASSGGGGGGGGSSSPTSTSTSTNINVATDNNTTIATQTVTSTTASNGVAAASVTSSQISEMLTAAEEKAFSGAQTVVALQVETASGVAGVSVTIPKAAVSTLTSGTTALSISSSVATVTLDRATLAEINKQTGGDVIITATAADTSALSDDAKNAIGTRPVYDLKITSGSTTISSFGGGTATVSVPYTPASGEDVNAIVVYYINASGELVTVPNCAYDAKNGTVTFTTTHFSTYAVGYNAVSFSDVTDNAWCADYVTYLASRGIVGGNNGAYSPDASITRAEFVTILARMSGDDLSDYRTSSFSDVSTDRWYFAAVQWVYKNGIASGYDGAFDPNANITREQMAVMLFNYAEYAGIGVSNVEGMSVREFSDYDSISSWAMTPIQWAINSSIISGNTDGRFAPTANATRAQAAKMIAVLMQGMIES